MAGQEFDSYLPQHRNWKKYYNISKGLIFLRDMPKCHISMRT